MTEGEKLFNEINARWMGAWSLIQNFRTTFVDVAPAAAKNLRVVHEDLFKNLIGDDPQWAGLLVNIGDSAKPLDVDKMAELSANEVLKTSYDSLDAASLIFYHSILDAMAFDCCRVTGLVAPTEWEMDLGSTKVALSDMREGSYENILRIKLAERLRSLERESLLEKIDRLFARCNPPKGWSPMRGYLFDQEKILQFDKQRHEIIHGQAMGRPLALFPLTSENLYYLLQTGMYLIGLLNQKYGLRIDTKYIESYLRQMKTP